jgi:hypothetical protein
MASEYPVPLRNWHVDECPPIIEREYCVPEGHTNQSGRLDLVIRFKDRAVIVIEVKTTSADDADTEKHQGYCLWLDRQGEPLKHSVILATESESDTYHNFAFLGWEVFCLRARHLALRYYHEKRIVVATMMLAFVGAEEQNILGFSLPTFNDSGPVTFNIHIVSYLRRWLDQSHDAT